MKQIMKTDNINPNILDKVEALVLGIVTGLCSVTRRLSNRQTLANGIALAEGNFQGIYFLEKETLNG